MHVSIADSRRKATTILTLELTPRLLSWCSRGVTTPKGLGSRSTSSSLSNTPSVYIIVQGSLPFTNMYTVRHLRNEPSLYNPKSLSSPVLLRPPPLFSPTLSAARLAGIIPDNDVPGLRFVECLAAEITMAVLAATVVDGHHGSRDGLPALEINVLRILPSPSTISSADRTQ